MNDIIIPAGFFVDVPHFGDYFGVWAIEPEAFRGLVSSYQGLNLHAHINSAHAAESVAQQNRHEFALDSNGIATFRIVGPTMKSVSSLSNGTSTVRVRQQIRAAIKSSDVRGAMLIMDTPGGTVRGNSDLADDVAEFAKAKPIYSFTEDMTASAGVSVASQATKRFANNPTALYGSMGVFSVLEDYSGKAEKLGIKVHVIKSGDHKGAGTPGTEITAAHLAEAQRIVDALADGYLGLIARGLGKDVASIKAIADGRVHPASVAKDMGLIDGIQSHDETYQQLLAATKRTTSMSVVVPNRPAAKAAISIRREAMNENAATLAELKAAFPKSTADWRESQIEAGATMQAAAIAYAAHVEARAETERAEHAKALEVAKSAATPLVGVSLGHEPLRIRGKGRQTAAAEDGATDADDRQEYIESGDAIEDFNAAVAKLAGPGADFGRRQRAIRTIANRDPELYQSYLLATNKGSRQTRLITEKMEAVRK